MNRFSAEREFFAAHPGEALDESGGLVFQVERLMAALPEMEIFFERHRGETLDKIPVDPDWSNHIAAEKCDALRLVTARANGRLVGYIMGFMRTHPQSRKLPCCFVDMFFLSPQYRYSWNGVKMLKTFLDGVTDRRVYVTTGLKLDLDSVLKRLGFSPIERVYVKP